MIMTATVTIKDIIAQYLSKFSLNRTGSDEVIRFSLSDIFYNQTKIVALWRELNKRGMKPVAKTFLGRITSISLHS
jgi:hypothetical protein